MNSAARAALDDTGLSNLLGYATSRAAIELRHWRYRPLRQPAGRFRRLVLTVLADDVLVSRPSTTVLRGDGIDTLAFWMSRG